MRAKLSVLGAAVAAALIAGCTSSGEVGGEIKIGKFHAYANGGWGLTGPKDICGCITFTDESGNPLDAPKGTIVNGAGGGVVPPGAKGWSVELTKCKSFEGCEDDDDEEELTLPIQDRASLAPYGDVVRRYLGIEVRDDRIVAFDFDVAGSTLTEVRATRDFVLESLTDAQLPEGVTIRQIDAYWPRYDKNGNFAGLEGIAIDDEPILAFALDVNGQAEVLLGASEFLGNGFFGVRHEVSTANLDLSWNGTHNEFAARRATQTKPLMLSEVALDWSPLP